MCRLTFEYCNIRCCLLYRHPLDNQAHVARDWIRSDPPSDKCHVLITSVSQIQTYAKNVMQ